MAVIAICSGKGGVGKTTISANLASLLTLYGSTLLIDSDIALPNLHTFLGLDDPFISLLDVLKDESYLNEAIYRVKLRFRLNVKELDVLPASTSVKALEEIDMNKFKNIVEGLRNRYDYIVIDVAAGLGKYALIPIVSSDDVYLVVNPEKASILDSQKVKKIADISGVRVKGIIMNRYKGEKKMVEYAENAIGAEIVGIIRDSNLVRKCWEEGVPVVVKKPQSNIAKEFFNLTRKIVGEDVEIKPYGKLRYLLG